MRIVFAASEAAPYWKTGGLADVARTLPDALAARGHDVRIVLPFYRVVRSRGLALEDAGGASLPWPGGALEVRWLEHRPGAGAPAILVDQPAVFDVDDAYAPDPADPLAPGVRFAVFCRAVVQLAKAWNADVVHLNDWPTGMAVVYAQLDGLAAPIVFAIHNMAYQGSFPPAILAAIGVPDRFFAIDDGVEFYGKVSFLKAALALADRLVTVSPTYAREIQTEEFGAGMHGLLRSRRDALHGILNGIDTACWNPATDAIIAQTYEAATLDRKAVNRRELLLELGLDGAGPLFAMVTRLAHQKGIDIVLDALPDLLRRDVRLAVLGDGDAPFEDALAAAVASHPARVAAILRFDEELARRIYAGSDFFLMPSRFEPCGLGQMIAQRYGTPPVVRRTGGLVDTVRDGATGFTFKPPTPAALLDAVDRAIAFRSGPNWNNMRRRCMALDRSWTRSAAEYEALYAAAIAARGKARVPP